MDEMKLGTVETRFADLIWENEPLTSGALVKLCEEKLQWKKSTTYTVLKKLCERGIFQNDSGVVSSLISKEEFCAKQSEKFLEETFDGSLPAFLAAFAKRRPLSDKEVEEIRALIDHCRKGD
ncbi:MAG: BlaI/MecI/CopY family transcriptional regulator [Ruminococcaceae bacterium]|nr:BlaI/MecI/CopY family transcriptional regulator [Oscillospiraceae bacterium]